MVAKCGKETSRNWSLKGLEGCRMERSFTNRIAVVLLAAGTWLLRRQGNGSMVTASLALAWFQGELFGKIRVYTYQNNQMLWFPINSTWNKTVDRQVTEHVRVVKLLQLWMSEKWFFSEHQTTQTKASCQMSPGIQKKPFTHFQPDTYACSLTISVPF